MLKNGKEEIKKCQVQPENWAMVDTAVTHQEEEDATESNVQLPKPTGKGKPKAAWSAHYQVP